MKQRPLSQGDLLYHAVHGLCRVDRVEKEQRNGKPVVTYALVPKVPNKMKMRYVIASTDLEVSGFHALVSLKDAEEILKYFKAGDVQAVPEAREAGAVPNFHQENQPWSLAQALLTFSQESLKLKDQRKLQLLERSAKGLVGELSFVMKTSLKETVGMVKKNLESSTRVNPQVLAALENACED